MGTGIRGTFVISWSQTLVDGFECAGVSSLHVGAAWSWRGEAVRVDGPSRLLELDRADDVVDIRRRAAQMVRRLVGAAVTNNSRLDTVEVGHPLSESGFTVTDGAQTYTVTLIDVDGAARPLLMFLNEIPPRGVDLRVVDAAPGSLDRPVGAEPSGRVICFTPGTRIRTPTGAVPVDALREGDLIQTKDNGPQEVQWVGSRRMTGARLFAMPGLRPVRIRAGAFGIERPDEEFLVSPEHRMLVSGPAARALFNTDEVLVRASDLVDGRTVVRDLTVREVTYVHLLLPRHEVLFANGVETESFHPASTALTTLRDVDRARLLAMMPGIAHSPQSYGGFARRSLSRPEAAILLHEAA
jgi:hypothetical protein